MAITAQVAVAGATIHFDKLYTYLVPDCLRQGVQVGSMVLVPFGRGTAKMRTGVVLDLQESETIEKRLKEIYDVAPEEARLSDELLELVHELRDKTFCTYYDAVKAIIPYGAQYKPVYVNGVPRLQKQIVRHTEKVYARRQEPSKWTQKQKLAWDSLSDGEKTQTELENLGVSQNVLDRMCEQGTLSVSLRDRNLTLYENYGGASAVPVLSPAQQKAFLELAVLLESGKPQAALLHGVTSSGKTLVFLKLIEKTIALGKQALVLVPEISLTPQMIYRLKAVFGDRVAVQHSALSNTERLLQWREIQLGKADIVVGTRSAVFAPLSRIGIIIIDEEQEHTYHSENAPRFLAHDIAKRRAVTHNALLLFASATPSLESYYAARTGRYHLVELTERYNRMPLPEVTMVDMREELAQGNAGVVSNRLAQEIQKNLDCGEQSILLLNRRGYQTVGMCTACGEVYKCDACSVPMVYHKASGKLLCHYCGKSVSPVPTLCPKCGGKMKYTGFGTQRVEEELEQRFPKARVLRMDLDSTSRKNAHEKMLQQFAEGKYDIMLGTQMVAKGLDFEKVTLVGVLGIDQMLFAQGYRAFENVFSLVTQVVGRGGRAARPGRALIQTVDPEHPVLALAAHQDYRSFYEQEIAFRKLNLYPPFCTICMVGFSGKEESKVMQAARGFAELIQQNAERTNKIPLRILGPAPMNIVMVNNHYRYKLTVKCRNDGAFRRLMHLALDKYNEKGLALLASIYLDFYSDADI
ncbi:primosomal protein N' [uncultured Ruthenibacterium sp.]|uniref:replication restart helicase PriA n=1 Tax=uncultured Ruthenibacterium sp. TaxID=1905347 RepID=UPI00349EE851